MQLGTINRTQIVGAVIILELALGALFYFYWYSPRQLELKTLEDTIEKKQRDKREIELTKKSLAETRHEISYLKAQIEYLEKAMPEEVFIPGVLMMIESLAAATHLNIVMIRPTPTVAKTTPGVPGAPGAAPGAVPTPAPAQPAAAGPPGAQQQKQRLQFNWQQEYRTLVVDFEVTGDFKSIYDFLRELSSFPKLVVVDTVTMALMSSGDQSGEKEEGTSSNAYTPKGLPPANLSVRMPLTFYIQQKQSPEMGF